MPPACHIAGRRERGPRAGETAGTDTGMVGLAVPRGGGLQGGGFGRPRHCARERFRRVFSHEFTSAPWHSRQAPESTDRRGLRRTRRGSGRDGRAPRDLRAQPADGRDQPASVHAAGLAAADLVGAVRLRRVPVRLRLAAHGRTALDHAGAADVGGLPDPGGGLSDRPSRTSRGLADLGHPPLRGVLRFRHARGDGLVLRPLGEAQRGAGRGECPPHRGGVQLDRGERLGDLLGAVRGRVVRGTARARRFRGRAHSAVDGRVRGRDLGRRRFLAAVSTSPVPRKPPKHCTALRSGLRCSPGPS